MKLTDVAVAGGILILSSLSSGSPSLTTPSLSQRIAEIQKLPTEQKYTALHQLARAQGVVVSPKAGSGTIISQIEQAVEKKKREEQKRAREIARAQRRAAGQTAGGFRRYAH